MGQALRSLGSSRLLLCAAHTEWFRSWDVYGREQEPIGSDEDLWRSGSSTKWPSASAPAATAT